MVDLASYAWVLWYVEFGLVGLSVVTCERELWRMYMSVIAACIFRYSERNFDTLVNMARLIVIPVPQEIGWIRAYGLRMVFLSAWIKIICM